MHTLSDTEKYIIEEIDVLIRTLKDIHFENLRIHNEEDRLSKKEVLSWYSDYLSERAQ